LVLLLFFDVVADGVCVVGSMASRETPGSVQSLLEESSEN